MTSGAERFGRFAFPPNAKGYCGPSDVQLVRDVLATGPSGADELRHIVTAFAGAWPYLDLIAGNAGRDPLDDVVVEAYWLGNRLLAGVDVLTWGNSLDQRFRARAGTEWAAIDAAINDGGVPTHAFHVFCVYPWVGLLRSGMVDQALGVLDQCRIRWGTVVADDGGRLLVASQPLEWDGTHLRLGGERAETVDQSVDPAAHAAAGDVVALHWNYVCQAVTETQLTWLRRMHQRHLDIVNEQTRRLSGSIER